MTTSAEPACQPRSTPISWKRSWRESTAIHSTEAARPLGPRPRARPWVCSPRAGKPPRYPSVFLIKWSEREDLNLRPLVSQTSALTGLRHAPNVVPLARIAALRKASDTILVSPSKGRGTGPKDRRMRRLTRRSAPDRAWPGRRRGRRAPAPAVPGPARWGRTGRPGCRPCGRW